MVISVLPGEVAMQIGNTQLVWRCGLEQRKGVVKIVPGVRTYSWDHWGKVQLVLGPVVFLDLPGSLAANPQEVAPIKQTPEQTRSVLKGPQHVGRVAWG